MNYLQTFYPKKTWVLGSGLGFELGFFGFLGLVLGFVGFLDLVFCWPINQTQRPQKNKHQTQIQTQKKPKKQVPNPKPNKTPTKSPDYR